MWCQIYVKATKQTHTLDGWYFLEIANIKPILFSILEYYFPIFLYGFWHMTYFKFHQNGCVMYIFVRSDIHIYMFAENVIIHFINPTFR